MQRITQLPEPPPRPDDGHKGTFGRVLIIGGSRGMSGAVALAGLGALRGGAGLVFLAVPASIVPIVASLEPSYLTRPLPETDEGRIARKAESQLMELLSQHDAVALGPGLGRSNKLTALVQSLVEECAIPMVIDADALFAFAEIELPLAGPAARVLTPHPGEFARLIKSDIAAVQSRREELATEYAAKHGVILVLKGHRTLITDGQRLAENTTGNCGMGTGGSGDVLTGLIAALLGQGIEAFAAAQLAVHLHGLAGDFAARELSQPGMIASDLPKFLPEAWCEFLSESQEINGV